MSEIKEFPQTHLSFEQKVFLGTGVYPIQCCLKCRHTSFVLRHDKTIICENCDELTGYWRK